jgi:hypothetical protein
MEISPELELFGNKVNQKKIVESSRKSWPKGLAKFNFG